VNDFKIGDPIWWIQEEDKTWIHPVTKVAYPRRKGSKFQGIILELLPKSAKVQVKNDKWKTAIKTVNYKNLKARLENETL
jgi:hypothetical protein